MARREFAVKPSAFAWHSVIPLRYSKDIDLVKLSAEPAGPRTEALRAVLNPWLATPPSSAHFIIASKASLDP